MRPDDVDSLESWSGGEGDGTSAGPARPAAAARAGGPGRGAAATGRARDADDDDVDMGGESGDAGGADANVVPRVGGNVIAYAAQPAPLPLLPQLTRGVAGAAAATDPGPGVAVNRHIAACLQTHQRNAVTWMYEK